MSLELFDRAAAEAVVGTNHFRYVARTGDDFVAEPSAISRRAGALIRAWRAARYEHDSTEAAHVAGAGLLVYAMDCYGFRFTYCARLSCPAVAKLLRCLRGDLGLDHEAHYTLLRSRAAEAPEAAQFVRLAELVEVADALRIKATPVWLAGDAREGFKNRVELQSWVDYAYDVIEGFKRRGLFAAGDMCRDYAKLSKVILDLHGRARSPKQAAARPAKSSNGEAVVGVPT